MRTAPEARKMLTAAVIQLGSQDDVAANLERAGAQIEAARAAGAELAVLPENFAFMGEEDDKRKIAEVVTMGSGDDDGPIVAFLRRTARAQKIFVVAGGMPEASDDRERPYNTSLLVAPSGEVVARYRKIHLFDVEVGDGHPYRESRATMPGPVPRPVPPAASQAVSRPTSQGATESAPSASDNAIVADAGGVPIGMTVCYDLRFPELYRRLTSLGARVVTVPAAFTLMTGKDHWHVLLRSRAIENQVYVLAAAQHGKHPRGRQTYGKSLIVDPWGDVIAQAPEGEGFALSRLDFARQDRVRTELPCLAHRRL